MYASDKAASAQKNAGKTAAAGSDAAAALNAGIYADQRNLNMPFYNSQLSALNQYNALMGLPATSQPQGGGAFSPQGYNAGQVGATPTQWFGGNKGVTPNQQLYSSDPRYKAAWDEISAQQKQGYGEGFNNNSTQKGWLPRLQAAYGAQAAPQGQSGTGTQQQPAMTQQQAFDQFRNTPGYQFGLDQGNKSVQTSAAARGGLYSGAAMKALQRFGNDYADQQGFTPYMNRIASAAGIGQTNPVGSLTSAAGQYGQTAGGLMQNSANARASGMQNAANAQQQGYQDAAGFLGQWYGGRG
jgi:hypothetical protein